MPTITIEQAGKHDGQEVTLRGWLYNLRESGKLLFPIFRDGTGVIQGVCSLKENPEAFASLKGLTQESSVIVTGRIRADRKSTRLNSSHGYISYAVFCLKKTNCHVPHYNMA